MVVSTVLACSACASMPVADPAVEGDQPETLEKITIPASIFEFANSDIEDNFEEFSDYCYSVERDGNDLILELRRRKKKNL